MPPLDDDFATRRRIDAAAATPPAQTPLMPPLRMRVRAPRHDIRAYAVMRNAAERAATPRCCRRSDDVDTPATTAARCRHAARMRDSAAGDDALMRAKFRFHAMRRAATRR